jgi:hypothetical protein
MKRITSLLVVALFSTFTLPTEVSAQFTKNTNQSRKLRSVLVGGSGNLIQSNATAAFIGGGTANTVGGSNAVVSGGRLNIASDPYSAVGGGYRNSNGTWYGTIAGGYFNSCSGTGYGTVGGGISNLASGFSATVPGGSRCKATHTGCFVWSGDGNADTVSFGDYTFTVRATGGVRFYTAAGTATGVALAPGGTTWGSPSDSNLKTKITAVDPRKILAKVASMPVTEWEYKTVPNRRYIGPMAQDFHAAFGLGSDDKSITTLDSDGVMYAAIQGLVEELKDREQEIRELKARLRSLEGRLDSMPPVP